MTVSRLGIGIAILAVTVASCTPRTRSSDPATLAPYAEAVEVTNRMAARIMVRYYTQGGGPHSLGPVGQYQTATFRLPRSDVGHIFVETDGGARVPRNRSLYELRRYKVDPRTGEEIRSR